MHPRHPLIFAALALFVFSACGNGAGDRFSLEDCTGPARDGIDLHLRDSQGYPIADATVTARDGNYVEVLRTYDYGAYAGAVERVGDYTLVIEIPGMSDTEIGPVEVRMADACHVQTQRRSIEFFP